MDYPDASLGLLTHAQFLAFQADRDRITRHAGVSTIEALDAQATWWLVKEVFDRYPQLDAFEVQDPSRDDTDTTFQDDEAISITGLQVDAFAAGQQVRAGKDEDPDLTRAAREIATILTGYRLASPEGLFDLVDTGGCERNTLEEWDWGQFGAGWAARRRERALDCHLPSPKARTPGTRL